MKPKYYKSCKNQQTFANNTDIRSNLYKQKVCRIAHVFVQYPLSNAINVLDR